MELHKKKSYCCGPNDYGFLEFSGHGTGFIEDFWVEKVSLWPILR